eukprot:TRINITY_DN26269_c0_g2_i1.p1 TRINITY_DN26269_c0_g2~~TRINITY_DN26269_c0_g2_i1.p1  ORF type:complete len:648 (-),score=143.37 TRINITY_DN26269_c0_g2_i1:49-1821(-)
MAPPPRARRVRCGSSSPSRRCREGWHDARQHAVHRAPGRASWWDACDADAGGRCFDVLHASSPSCGERGGNGGGLGWAEDRGPQQAREPPAPWLGWPTPGPSEDKLLLKMRQARNQGHVDWASWSWEADMARRRAGLASPAAGAPGRRTASPRSSGRFARLRRSHSQGSPLASASAGASGGRGGFVRWPPDEHMLGPQQHAPPTELAAEPAAGPGARLLRELHRAFAQLAVACGGGKAQLLAAPRAAVVDLLDQRWWDLPSAARPAWWELRARLAAELKDWILWRDFAAMVRTVLPHLGGYDDDGAWFGHHASVAEEDLRPPPDAYVARPPPEPHSSPGALAAWADWEGRLEGLLQAVASRAAAPAASAPAPAQAPAPASAGAGNGIWLPAVTASQKTEGENHGWDIRGTVVVPSPVSLRDRDVSAAAAAAAASAAAGAVLSSAAKDAGAEVTLRSSGDMNFGGSTWATAALGRATTGCCSSRDTGAGSGLLLSDPLGATSPGARPAAVAVGGGGGDEASRSPYASVAHEAFGMGRELEEAVAEVQVKLQILRQRAKSAAAVLDDPCGATISYESTTYASELIPPPGVTA